MLLRYFLPLALLSVALPLNAATLTLTWPTPHPAFNEGLGYEAFVQPTATGQPTSALFGCVRNSGTRFHEGLDIAPYLERQRGEATDPVRAVLPGRVAYINTVAGNSGYGRYVVVVHDQLQPELYTLYAHLRKAADGLREGQRVEAGQEIGTMGRSAGGYAIPQDRAHLHLEVGLRLSDNFATWYTRQKFETPNQHGNYNGLNLVGMDPLAFFQDHRRGLPTDLRAYFRELPVGAVLRVRTARTPDFVRRYPGLVEGSRRDLAGWDIAVTGWGLPVRFTPLGAEDVANLKGEGTVSVQALDPSQLEAYGCRDLVDYNGRTATLGDDGRQLIELLFGFR